VELYEQIRREYEHGAGTIRAVARKLGVHRREVRKALASAVPAARKIPERERPKLAAAIPFMDGILESDRKAPAQAAYRASYLDANTTGDACGGGGGIDGAGVRAREEGRDGIAGAGNIHIRTPTSKRFWKAHELAFAHLGGVFRVLRYDNLKSAVKKILRGHQREETARFIAFRSHWGFESEFCTPGEGHEKGGVEGEGGHGCLLCYGKPSGNHSRRWNFSKLPLWTESAKSVDCHELRFASLSGTGSPVGWAPG
jgi:hypothetical protein